MKYNRLKTAHLDFLKIRKKRGFSAKDIQTIVNHRIKNNRKRSSVLLSEKLQNEIEAKEKKRHGWKSGIAEKPTQY